MALPSLIRSRAIPFSLLNVWIKDPKKRPGTWNTGPWDLERVHTHCWSSLPGPIDVKPFPKPHGIWRKESRNLASPVKSALVLGLMSY